MQGKQAADFAEQRLQGQRMFADGYLAEFVLYDPLTWHRQRLQFGAGGIQQQAIAGMAADGFGHPPFGLVPLCSAQRIVFHPVAGFVRGQRQIGEASFVHAVVPGRMAVPVELVGGAHFRFGQHAVGGREIGKDQPVPHMRITL